MFKHYTASYTIPSLNVSAIVTTKVRILTGERRGLEEHRARSIMLQTVAVAYSISRHAVNMRNVRSVGVTF